MSSGVLFRLLLNFQSVHTYVSASKSCPLEYICRAGIKFVLFQEVKTKCFFTQIFFFFLNNKIIKTFHRMKLNIMMVFIRHIHHTFAHLSIHCTLLRKYPGRPMSTLLFIHSHYILNVKFLSMPHCLYSVLSLSFKFTLLFPESCHFPNLLSIGNT